MTPHFTPKQEVPTTLASVTAIKITITCTCGADHDEEIELHGEGMTWEPALDDRFHLCDECGQVIDAGVTVHLLPGGEYA